MLEYVGMKDFKHVNERKFFIPEVSMKNVDSWKHSQYQDAIKFIEAGATRLGTSHGVDLIEGKKEDK